MKKQLSGAFVQKVKIFKEISQLFKKNALLGGSDREYLRRTSFQKKSKKTTTGFTKLGGHQNTQKQQKHMDCDRSLWGFHFSDFSKFQKNVFLSFFPIILLGQITKK